MRFIIAGGLASVAFGSVELAGRLLAACRPSRPRRRSLTGALVLSILVIAVVTLLPTHGANEVRLRPMGDIAHAVTSGNPALLLGAFANVLLFAPLGGVLRLQGLRARSVILTGALLSASVELIQLRVPGRTTSVDDVILNAAGVAVGYWLARHWDVRIGEDDAALARPAVPPRSIS